MLFLSDPSRQECSTYATRVPRSRFTNGSQEGEKFCASNKHTVETGHHMCRIRDRTPSRVREKTLHSVRTAQSARGNQKTRLAPQQVRGGQDQTSLVLLQSTWMDQTKDSALLEVHKRHGFALLRVRGHKLVLGRVYQVRTVRYTRVRSTTSKMMTINDANNAALFLMG